MHCGPRWRRCWRRADKTERDPEALSESRAAAVVEALKTLGVEGARLSARGVGTERPLALSDSEQERALNRTVTFRIAKMR
jgi:outer membrane protein OmpA-like peptidoglycan-associated protein